MQDRLVKATHSSEARVNVQRVQVAAQAVQSSLQLIVQSHFHCLTKCLTDFSYLFS